jgi:hypothetical protein
MKEQRHTRVETKFHAFLTWTLKEGDKAIGYEAKQTPKQSGMI